MVYFLDERKLICFRFVSFWKKRMMKESGLKLQNNKYLIELDVMQCSFRLRLHTGRYTSGLQIPYRCKPSVPPYNDYLAFKITFFYFSTFGEFRSTKLIDQGAFVSITTNQQYFCYMFFSNWKIINYFFTFRLFSTKLLIKKGLLSLKHFFLIIGFPRKKILNLLSSILDQIWTWKYDKW